MSVLATASTVHRRDARERTCEATGPIAQHAAARKGGTPISCPAALRSRSEHSRCGLPAGSAGLNERYTFVEGCPRIAGDNVGCVTTIVHGWEDPPSGGFCQVSPCYFACVVRVDWMSKKAGDKKVNDSFGERDTLIVLAAGMVSFLCALGTALPVWVQVAPSYGAAMGCLASRICALTTGIVSFLGSWSPLRRLGR